MKKAPEISNKKASIVAIDPALNKYNGKIIFPEKLEKTNKMLKTAKLPLKKKS